MGNIQIIGTGSYLPKIKVENDALEDKLNLPKGYIYSRCGILERRYIEKETLVDMSINATLNLIKKYNVDSTKIEMIIVASTSNKNQMPGISYQVQSNIKNNKCICLDISAGCSGFINALDIARLYILQGIVSNALVIGVDILSNITKEIGTKILLADGAGAVFIEKTENKKQYYSYIESNGTEGNILTYEIGNNIHMEGKEIYRYAVTKTVENVQELLKIAKKTIHDIDYFIPHQSNKKIMDSISKRLEIKQDKMICNIEKVGNTFCASIPIALDNIFENIESGKNILFLGYGGGLNTGSILLEK